jgi:hypothetical protein
MPDPGDFVRGETPEEAAAYRAARTNHDTSVCDGTWRAHTDPQERLDCIRAQDRNRYDG